MIYLDQAATTLQKPPAVGQSMLAALKTCAGYARSGHPPAIRAGDTVFHCRELAAALFDVPSPEQVIFTLNATHALNLAIHALCPPGTRVAVSGYEHNSVIRPLHARGIEPVILRSGLFDEDEFIVQAERAVASGVQVFIANHVSNVFGAIAPLSRLDDLLHAHQIPLIVDASQSAGVLPLSAAKLRSVSAICMPGHKALMGPQGTGMLLALSDALKNPLMQGGTGSVSIETVQPEFLPDAQESGTPNVPGIAGLAAGLEFIGQIGIERIAAHERMLLRCFADRLRSVRGLEVFCSSDPARQIGVLSVRSAGISCEQLAAKLSERDVCTRAGLHCAPLAHETAGTLATGTVRFSVGWYNTPEEMEEAAGILQEILLEV